MATLSIVMDELKLQQLKETANQMGLPVEEFIAQSIDASCARLQDDFDVRIMYPHLAKTFGPAGWMIRKWTATTPSIPGGNHELPTRRCGFIDYTCLKAA